VGEDTIGERLFKAVALAIIEFLLDMLLFAAYYSLKQSAINPGTFFLVSMLIAISVGYIEYKWINATKRATISFMAFTILLVSIPYYFLIVIIEIGSVFSQIH
jgi:hypothetical protein